MGSGTSQSHEADVSHPAPETFEGQLLALLPVMRRYSRSLAKSDAEGEDHFHQPPSPVAPIGSIGLRMVRIDW